MLSLTLGHELFFLYYKSYSSNNSCLEHLRIQLIVLFLATTSLVSFIKRITPLILSQFRKKVVDPAINYAEQKSKQTIDSLKTKIMIDNQNDDVKQNTIIIFNLKFNKSTFTLHHHFSVFFEISV